MTTSAEPSTPSGSAAVPQRRRQITSYKSTTSSPATDIAGAGMCWRAQRRLHKQPSSPAKAGDPVITGVGVYGFPAFAGMTPGCAEPAVPILTLRRTAKTPQASRLVIIELAGLGPVRRAHRHDEFGGLVRGVE